MFKILAINPGSTSTKIGVFEDDRLLLKSSIEHSADSLKSFSKITDQFEMRQKDILNFLSGNGYDINNFDAFSARGGILPPLSGGTYLVNDIMIDYLKNKSPVEHASNLAALIAYDFSKKTGKNAYITDPVSVDEFEDLAYVSGMPELRRKSLLHALNMKAVSRIVANELGKDPKDCNFVIAHLGGGISVGAQKAGKIIDVNGANDEGPFSPERTGGLPVGDVAKLCYSGEYTAKELKNLFTKSGGLVAYLNTNSLKDAMTLAKDDDHAREVIEAMVFQIAKEIGAMCCVLKGKIDAIILTGGMANNIEFIEMIKEYISSFALIAVVPGENELESLAMGTLRVLRREEFAIDYEVGNVK